MAAVFAEKWIEIGSQRECDGYAGEVYLDSSQGKVPTLDACKKLCEDQKSCKSISYFKTKWCSHWSTPCTKTRWNKKVAVSLTLDGKKIEEEKNDDTWSKIGGGIICDHEAGEKYLDSSIGKVPTLEACKQSCNHAKLCKSVSYTGWCNGDDKYSVAHSSEIKNTINQAAKTCATKLAPMSVCTDDASCSSRKCEWMRRTQSNINIMPAGPAQITTSATPTGVTVTESIQINRN